MHSICHRIIVIAALCCLITAGVAVAQPNLQVLALYKDKAMVVYKGKNKVLSVGDVLDKNFKLISADSKSAVFDYNGTKYSYAISFHINNDYTGDTDGKLTLMADAQNKYHITLSINGNTTAAIIDPKEENVLISSEYADKIQLKYKDQTGSKINVPLGSSVGYKVVLPEIVLEKVLKVGNVDAIVVHGTYPEQPLLGEKFLTRVKVSENQDKRTLTLEAMQK